MTIFTMLVYPSLFFDSPVVPCPSSRENELLWRSPQNHCATVTSRFGTMTKFYRQKGWCRYTPLGKCEYNGDIMWFCPNLQDNYYGEYNHVWNHGIQHRALNEMMHHFKRNDDDDDDHHHHHHHHHHHDLQNDEDSFQIDHGDFGW